MDKGVSEDFNNYLLNMVHPNSESVLLNKAAAKLFVIDYKTTID